MKSLIERFYDGDDIHTIADIRAVQTHMESKITALIGQFERQARGCVVRELRIHREPIIGASAVVRRIELTIEID
jgi:hypothetical protein